ncbi:hypothetical protein [Caproicibacter fermentans]|uniref:hypothetical protein n=1 Tax=Caproicibacter fermentans TaxID=2576756 RepID=UPI0012ED00DD|nr:hypothetical protein [Caproicibacter fermentans]
MLKMKRKSNRNHKKAGFKLNRLNPMLRLGLPALTDVKSHRPAERKNFGQFSYSIFSLEYKFNKIRRFQVGCPFEVFRAAPTYFQQRSFYRIGQSFLVIQPIQS